MGVNHSCWKKNDPSAAGMAANRRNLKGISRTGISTGVLGVRVHSHAGGVEAHTYLWAQLLAFEMTEGCWYAFFMRFSRDRWSRAVGFDWCPNLNVLKTHERSRKYQTGKKTEKSLRSDLVPTFIFHIHPHQTQRSAPAQVPVLLMGNTIRVQLSSNNIDSRWVVTLHPHGPKVSQQKLTLMRFWNNSPQVLV